MRANQHVPELVKTTAITGEGVVQLVAAIERQLKKGQSRRSESRTAIESEIVTLTETAWHEFFWERLGLRERLTRRLNESDRRPDPYAIAAEFSRIEIIRESLHNAGQAERE